MSRLGWVPGQRLLAVVWGKGGNVGTGVGAGTVAVGFTGALVGMADGKAEGVAEGTNVAVVGASVVAVPQPAIINPTNIKSRTREVSFRFISQLPSASSYLEQRPMWASPAPNERSE
jgi:hypothetical protein